jgi:hypothetical protein
MEFQPVRLIFFALCLTGCSSVPPKQTATFHWTTPSKRIFLDHSRVQLSELNVGGRLEARADWTAVARNSIANAVTSDLAAKGVEVIAREDTTVRSFEEIRGQYGTDYQLSFSIQASYSSTGQVAANAGKSVLNAVLVFAYAAECLGRLGCRSTTPFVPVRGGMADGRATLVDLRTGATIWSAVIDANAVGRESSSQHMIEKLLKDVHP